MRHIFLATDVQQELLNEMIGACKRYSAVYAMLSPFTDFDTVTHDVFSVIVTAVHLRTQSCWTLFQVFGINSLTSVTTFGRINCLGATTQQKRFLSSYFQCKAVMKTVYNDVINQVKGFHPEGFCKVRQSDISCPIIYKNLGLSCGTVLVLFGVAVNPDYDCTPNQGMKV
ncbi:hypothetical protein CLF_103534 [Clonorchis sinensis]|uniref:Uncharacterized protein n=1 Tax=Clonorchis sinensis TaxID=79923 RepID=G7YNH3_CLOSI|nr:hypothetical protein CLF_103534 [Clonorchis sinensis]